MYTYIRPILITVNIGYSKWFVEKVLQAERAMGGGGGVQAIANLITQRSQTVTSKL